MAAVAKAKGVKPKKPGPPPRGAEHLWRAFVELDAARGGNGFGPNPIGFADIQAWAILTDNPLAPWEVRAVRMLDDAYLESLAPPAEDVPK